MVIVVKLGAEEGENGTNLLQNEDISVFVENLIVSLCICIVSKYIV